MCWYILHCFLTQLGGVDPSNLFPAEGAVALGLACAPQHLHLSYRGRDQRGFMQRLLPEKKKNSSRSLLAFALLLITSGVIGMGAPVPHVLGLLLFTPTRCF